MGAKRGVHSGDTQDASYRRPLLLGQESELTYHIHRDMNSNVDKMRQQRNMFQTKEQNKTPEELSELEIGNLPKKEFKVMIIKKIQELGRRMDAQSKKSEVFNKQLQNHKETPNRDEEYNN